MQINDIITLAKDQYQLIEAQIGGAQAYVFKVRRVSDEQILALKIARIWKKPNTLLPISRVNANCKRIQQEIEFLQALEKPEAHYIVACLDAMTVQQGGKNVPAFVMPFYEQSLSKVLLEEQQPTLAQHLAWIQQMIVALKYIHHHHKNGEALVHRDFKLDNLMLNKTGEIRLLDFGISKHVLRSTDSTHTKMNYSDDCVAPEQILLIKPNTDGKKHVAIGTHTDIYALGLLIYRLIAGHLPESHEAFIMNLEEISQQHRKALNQGEEGLLGKIGGINQQETDFLVESFIDLAEGTPVTFLYDDDDELDDDVTTQTDSPYHALAERFAEFVAELLDKRYQYRPNAKSALHWIENIQFKLNALDKNNSTETQSQTEPQTEPQVESQVEPETEYVAVSTVSSTNEDTNKTVFIPAVEQQPDQPSNHQAPKRPPFFTPPKKTESTKGISVSPEQEQEMPIIPRNWPVKRLLLVLGVVLLMVNAWLLLRSEPEQVLPEIDSDNTHINTDINTDIHTDINTQVTNTVPTHTTTTPSPYQPPKINRPPSPNKENLGDNTKKWAEVIPKLKRLAEHSNAEASALLAHAYHYGKGGKTDWGKAWHYYQQALQQDSEGKDNRKYEQRQQALEIKANQILTDTDSSAAQRKKAYQLIEVIANQDLIPLSINARLWMEYRYRTGDGVRLNHARADAWKKKYNAIKDGIKDGIKDETP
ncbi:MAG TPA: hypothetical protein ENJ33_05800 [Thiothrix sp.]|nr:hypothetical protein [Thiothrix sp.]